MVTDDLATTGLFSLAAPLSRLFLMSPDTQKSKWGACLEWVGIGSDGVCVRVPSVNTKARISFPCLPTELAKLACVQLGPCWVLFPRAYLL